MKPLIALAILAALVSAGCSSNPAPATTTRDKTSPSNSAQFRPSDHMPPEALAAKKAAGG